MKAMLRPNRRFLEIECVLLSLVLPIALYLIGMRGVLYAALWVLSVVIVSILYYEGAWKSGLINFRAVNWRNMRPMLIRFVLCAVLLTGLLLWMDPGRFLSLPRERTQLWIMIMLLYPFLSVVPQELIFRTWYFYRYKSLFPEPHGMIIVSSVAFGFAHLILQNWIGIILSGVGGLIFGHTYHRTRSLALVSLEHALYGCFVFTIGLGWYFYSGAAR